ncbi:hypothetical protein [Ectothiorhodospira haloalkaliphila]|uniref:hypothetical protein n=1 Tax=Ectothiorhodospira haloalkaliphila TaxID=421628 RepID=UPI0004B01EEB|nr:hypothetical protein [Ectothiorhodospira haloalkaliphila]
MIQYLVAFLIIFALFTGWVLVQHAARRFAQRHPEFGPPQGRRRRLRLRLLQLRRSRLLRQERAEGDRPLFLKTGGATPLFFPLPTSARIVEMEQGAVPICSFVENGVWPLF